MCLVAGEREGGGGVMRVSMKEEGKDGLGMQGGEGWLEDYVWDCGGMLL